MTGTQISLLMLSMAACSAMAAWWLWTALNSRNRSIAQCIALGFVLFFIILALASAARVARPGPITINLTNTIPEEGPTP